MNNLKHLPFDDGFMDAISDKISIPAEWKIFIRTLARKREDVSNRLTKWYVLPFREELYGLHLLSDYGCKIH